MQAAPGQQIGHPQSSFNPTVIISEIGWAGTISEPSTAQWIELYNTEASAVDLNNWTLAGQFGSPSVVLTGIIPANGFYLLVRSTNSSQATAAHTTASAHSGCLHCFQPDRCKV